MAEEIIPVPVQPVCPQCHLPVRPEFYFCPNCGENLRKPPLATSAIDQTLLYLFSAVLPWIAYLAITRWQGVRYMRSADARTRAIGWVALGILVASSIVAVWLTTAWINQQINSALNTVGTINGGFSTF